MIFSPQGEWGENDKQDIYMKKLLKISKKVSFAVAMAAFTHMANAATASTDTMITATVKSPTKLSVDYAPKAPLIANKSNDGKVFAILNVSGYAHDTTGSSLRFSDKGGVSGRLTFTNSSDPTKSFLAKMLYNGYENQPWINNGPGGIMGPLPEKVFFYIKVHDQTVISPGVYSDVINVTVLNR